MKFQVKHYCLQFAVLSAIVVTVQSHGRLLQPPSRSSMWRYGFATPTNYNDNELNCGGSNRQWVTNAGQCGLCGDPYDGPRQNEAGGRYATGLIGRSYTSGQPITIQVEITSAHGGWFEFRLCPNNNTSGAITQECLDQHVLQTPERSTRYNNVPKGGTAGAGFIDMVYSLPAHVTCTQCVLQWKYRTSKDWGCEVVDGRTNCGVGYGPQEEFYGCADIAIQTAGQFATGKTQNSASTIVTFSSAVKSAATAKPTIPAEATNERATHVPTANPFTTTLKPRLTTGKATDEETQTTRRRGETTPAASQTASNIVTKPTKISPFDALQACKGRGSLEGTLMDKNCRSSCRKGYCAFAFCNDACHRLL